MHKYLLLLLVAVLQPSVWAGWVYFTNNNHGSSDYYYAPIEDKGKVKVLRTFTQLPVDAKVPYHTPKAVVKVTLYNYSSEQSTYEINCQEQSIQLMERIFIAIWWVRCPSSRISQKMRLFKVAIQNLRSSLLRRHCTLTTFGTTVCTRSLVNKKGTALGGELESTRALKLRAGGESGHKPKQP